MRRRELRSSPGCDRIIGVMYMYSESITAVRRCDAAPTEGNEAVRFVLSATLNKAWQVKRWFRSLGLLMVSALVLASAAYASASDIVPDAWYESAVQYMWDHGYLTGYPDGTFRPNQSVTAAEYVTILSRITGLAPMPTHTEHWASGNMESALCSGWYDWDEIPPTGEKFDDPIVRQLAVKILMNALFPDERGDYNTQSRRMRDFSELDGRYYDAVIAAYASGLVRGDEEGNFHPKGFLTRAEACMLLYRAMQGAPVSEENAGTAPTLSDTVSSTGVSKHGWLQVRGTQLCGEAGEPVVLRGMSSHGLHWFPQYTGAQAMRNLAAYGANLFELPCIPQRAVISVKGAQCESS